MRGTSPPPEKSPDFFLTEALAASRYPTKTFIHRRESACDTSAEWSCRSDPDGYRLGTSCAPTRTARPLRRHRVAAAWGVNRERPRPTSAAPGQCLWMSVWPLVLSPPDV